MLKVSANLRNGRTEKKLKEMNKLTKILNGQTDKNWKRLAEGKRWKRQTMENKDIKTSQQRLSTKFKSICPVSVH